MKNFIFGKWEEDAGVFDGEKAHALLQKAEEVQRLFSQCSMEDVYRVFSKLKARWSNPEDPLRRETIELLVPETGFSHEMITLGIDQLGLMFDPVRLKKKISTELKNLPPYGEQTSGLTTKLEWCPLGIVLHVISGNVFLVAASSLIEGLLTRNVTILKMASTETVFLPRLLQSIAECDDTGVIHKTIAAVSFSSRETESIQILKDGVDGIVVWGGEEAVRAYRNDLPARTRFIAFGPKLSFCVVTKEGIKKFTMQETARRLAREISIWDQNSCTAPQMCLVESEELREELMDALVPELEAMRLKIPPGAIDRDTAIEIHKLRTTAEVEEALGLGRLIGAPGRLDWTLVSSKSDEIETSPLHRTLKLAAFSNLKEISHRASALKGYLQTVGMIASPLEAETLRIELGQLGAVRLVEIGGMSGGEIDDPHDGAYDLPQLLRLSLDRLGVKSEEKSLDRRLSALYKRASMIPSYQRYFNGATLKGRADLSAFPILSSSKMRELSEDVAKTQTWTGGYVARSGGSTGEPKFSIYDHEDWNNLVDSGAELMRSLGLRPTDRIGNFMMAGNLYGSFVSCDHIFARLGVASFAFAGLDDPNPVASTWMNFQFKVVMGIPTHLVPLLRLVKEKLPAFSLEIFLYAGSALPQEDENWLRQELGVKQVSSIIGANDGGQYAFQCGKQRRREHHLLDDFNWVEIVDDEDRVVPDGQEGRILITSLKKFTVPLIRYDIGDRGKILTKSCECGHSSRLLEYLGRSGDVFEWKGKKIHVSDLEAALEGAGHSLFQLVISKEAGLSLKLEGATERMESVEKIISRMKLIFKDTEQLKVEVFSPGGIPRNPRSSKVSSLIDFRT